MAARFEDSAPHYFDTDATTPLDGGLLNFYDPGTLDRKDTFSDNALTAANANPVVLSSVGLLPSVFLNGDYRVICTDSAGVQIYDRNNVNALFASVVITGGTIDGATIGGSTPAAGTFTTLATTGLTTFGEDITFSQSNPEVRGGDTNGALFVSASTTNALGGNAIFYAESHSTKAGDIEFRNTSTIKLGYDLSALRWNFADDLAFTHANPEIIGGDTNGVLRITGGATNILGSNVILYGDTHATKADDFEVYGSATLQLLYDDSASSWDFQANAIATTGAITAGGILKTDSTIDATSTTDGSLQTDGGLSVVKKTVLGDDLTITEGKFTLTNTANEESLLITSSTTGSPTLNIVADSQQASNTIFVSADGLTTGGMMLLLSDSSSTSTRNLVDIRNDNTAAVNVTLVKLQQDAVLSTNFKRYERWDGMTFYISDGTTAEGALTGVEGDICYNGGTANGQAAFCDNSGTNWTDM